MVSFDLLSLLREILHHRTRVPERHTFTHRFSLRCTSLSPKNRTPGSEFIDRSVYLVKSRESEEERRGESIRRGKRRRGLPLQGCMWQEDEEVSSEKRW